MSHSQAMIDSEMLAEMTARVAAQPAARVDDGEPFPVEEIAAATPEAAAAFRDQTAVLRAAAWIREMREGAGFTQRELARRVGTTQPYLSELERGTGAQGPSFLMLDRIATACGRVLRVEVDVAERQPAHRAAA